jgi:hypothetical protein
MTRVDLDGWQATVDQWRRAGAEQVAAGISTDGLAALVAELRAAREVVEAADLYWTTFGDETGGAIPDRLAHALNAYDEVMGS